MSIKDYIDRLEKTKKDLLSLNLPDNTLLVWPPDHGIMRPFRDVKTKFEAKETYKYSYDAGESKPRESFMINKYVFGHELTETQTVVIVSSNY